MPTSTRRSIVAGLLVCVCLAPPTREAAAEPLWNKAQDPGRLGWSASKLAALKSHTDRLGTAAFMIVTDGQIVHAQGDLDRSFLANSMRKSFMSALFGIYIERGKIDTKKTLADLGIDDKQPLTPVEKTATVMQLLQARSGVYHPAASEIDAMREARPARGAHAPGTHWYYNNWDFNALGTIFEKETGADIFEAFARDIAEPIGMQDFDIGANWYKTEDGSVHRSYKFRISARDLARFGLLYLNGGRWKDKPIVPAKWVEESTAVHSRTGDDGTKSGYGLMWWVATEEDRGPGLDVDGPLYTASGNCGQRLTVIPALQTVVVHLIDTERRVNGEKTCIGSSKYDRLLSEILAARQR